MESKKNALIGLKNVIREEVNKFSTKLNEIKISGGGFEDYEFRYSGDEVKFLILTYRDKPLESLIRKDLSIIKNNFKEGSIYNTYEPKVAIIYPFVRGWDRGWNVFFTTEEDDGRYDSPFPDEPAGRFKMGRRKIISL